MESKTVPWDAAQKDIDNIYKGDVQRKILTSEGNLDYLLSFHTDQIHPLGKP